MEPLTSPDCDLREFTFMPLDVARLRDSDLAAEATGDEFRAAVLLWCAAWHQVPAGSLPNDDKVISHLAGYGRAPKEWRKIRDGALHGFVLCSDDRLYHPHVADKANEAWNSRAKFAEKREQDRERLRKWREERRVSNNDGNSDETRFNISSETPEKSDETRGEGTVDSRQGTGEKKKEEKDDGRLPLDGEPDAPDGASGRYAFDGAVIRLNEIDFARWRKTYHSIPDIEAELSSLDAWFQGDGVAKAKSWFHAAQGALNRKHQANMAAERDGSSGPAIC